MVYTVHVQQYRYLYRTSGQVLNTPNTRYMYILYGDGATLYFYESVENTAPTTTVSFRTPLAWGTL